MDRSHLLPYKNKLGGREEAICHSPMVGGFELFTNTMLLLSLEMILANALKLKLRPLCPSTCVLYCIVKSTNKLAIECIGFNPKHIEARTRPLQAKDNVMYLSNTLLLLINYVKSDPTYISLIL